LSTPLVEEFRRLDPYTTVVFKHNHEIWIGITRWSRLPGLHSQLKMVDDRLRNLPLVESPVGFEHSGQRVERTQLACGNLHAISTLRMS
jgi:hypothetical protein